MPGECGIYAIRNLITNERYIGSSHDMRQRIAKHFYMLSKNLHHNRALQMSFSVHGRGAFISEELLVLEGYLSDYLLDREDFYIRSFSNVFNAGPIPQRTMPVPFEVARRRYRRDKVMAWNLSDRFPIGSKVLYDRSEEITVGRSLDARTKDEVSATVASEFAVDHAGVFVSLCGLDRPVCAERVRGMTVLDEANLLGVGWDGE